MTGPFVHDALAEIPVRPVVSPPEDVLDLAESPAGRELIRAVWQAGFDAGWLSAPHQPPLGPYRLGRSNPHTMYRQVGNNPSKADVPIGFVLDPDEGRYLVGVLNAAITGNAVSASGPVGRLRTATESTEAVTGSPECPATDVDAYGGTNR